MFDRNKLRFVCATRETENSHNHQCKYTLHKHACRSSEKPLASAKPVALVPPDKQSRKQNITSTSVQRSKSPLHPPGLGLKLPGTKFDWVLLVLKEFDRGSKTNVIASLCCFLINFVNKGVNLTNLVQWLTLSSNGCSPCVIMASRLSIAHRL